VSRERSNRAYDTLSYFIAKFFVELPLNLVPALIFSCVVYYIVGLNPNVFGYFILIVMLSALTAIALGLSISAAVPTVEAALALGPPCIIIALLFGGFYINLSSLPIVANLIPYVSFLRWGFQALCINEFTGATFVCDPGVPLYQCQTTGEQVPPPSFPPRSGDASPCPACTPTRRAEPFYLSSDPRLPHRVWPRCSRG